MLFACTITTSTAQASSVFKTNQCTNFNNTCPIKTKLSVYDRVSIIYFKFLYKKSGRPGLESIRRDNGGHVFINKEIDQPF